MYHPLVFCLINLPIHAAQFWSREALFKNNTLCRYTTSFRYVNVFADWMSVGMIAVSRCMSLKKIYIFERNAKYIAISIWVYAAILFFSSAVSRSDLILTSTYVHTIFATFIYFFQTYGIFGYDCITGKCDLLPGSHFWVSYGLGIGNQFGKSRLFFHFSLKSRPPDRFLSSEVTST